MIDYQSVRYTLEKLITLNFAEVPVQLENTRIDDDVPEYVSVNIQDVDSDPFDMDGDIYLVQGLLILGIYTKLGSGIERSRELASMLNMVILTAADSTITFGTPTLTSAGQVEDANYYLQNLNVQFQYVYAGLPATC
jgi:hypothetical protein